MKEFPNEPRTFVSSPTIGIPCCTRDPVIAAGFHPIARKRRAAEVFKERASCCEIVGGKDAHRVLVEPAVSHLGKAPQALNHMEGKLAAGAAARGAAVDRFLVCGEFGSGFGPAIDPIADTRVLAVRPVILTPIGLIAVQFGPPAKRRIGSMS